MKISIFADSKFITDGKGNYYSSSNMRKGMLYPIADQCERVYIVCRLKQGDLSRIPFEDMINHPHITFVGISFFKGILGALIHKKIIIKKAIYAIENSDVCVFRFGSSISCIAVPIAKKLKKPAIGHVVGEFDMEVRNNPKHIKVPGIRHLVASWILKQNIKAFQQCDCLCGVTLSIASKYAPPTQEVFQLVDSCLDRSCYQIQDIEKGRPGRLRAIFAGRLVPFKNVQNFLHAMAKVKQEGVAINTTIVGDGDYKESLVKLAENLGIADSVEFTGRIESRRTLWEKYRQADVGFLLSYSEGLPLGAIEPMSAGLPLIASKLEYMESIVTDGIEGYLVNPDDIDAIAHKLQILSADPLMRSKMGLNAYAKAKHFSAENQANKLLSIAKKLKGVDL